MTILPETEHYQLAELPDSQRGSVTQQAPFVYQVVQGMRREVPSHYVLETEASANAGSTTPTVGFELGEYDPTQPLIIDPILSYSTFVGGTNNDFGWSIAVDAEGFAYVTGSTFSVDFPVQNAFQPMQNGPASDAFVLKLDPSGSGLVYSTYLGGTGNDFGLRIALDDFGFAYVIGTTYATTGSQFPTTNAMQPTFGGGVADAFVTKLNQDGSDLVFSTFLGGSEFDGGTDVAASTDIFDSMWRMGIALDGEDAVYVTGTTFSDDFPVTNGAMISGTTDAFVTKLDPDGSFASMTPEFSTFLGGGSSERGQDIAVDAEGSVFVVGATMSGNFPTTTGAIDTSFNNGTSTIPDGYFTRLDQTGSITYSTFLGSSAADEIQAIALDQEGNAYVTGYSGPRINAPLFPVTTGPAYGGGFTDAFVAKINPSGAGLSDLVYATYLGGNQSDHANDIDVDEMGSAHVIGHTNSSDYPTVDSIQTSSFGDFDVIVSKLNSAGDSLLFSTYLGGTSFEDGLGIAVDFNGDIYGTGYSFDIEVPPGFPTTPGAFQTNNQGLADGFAFKIQDVANEFGQICGTKWHDLDGDGVRDANEPTLQGWIIYIDANNNGQLDAGETSVTTDANGDYCLTGLTSGTYNIAEVVQNGWEQTFPFPGSAPLQVIGYLAAVKSNCQVHILDQNLNSLSSFSAGNMAMDESTAIATDGTLIYTARPQTQEVVAYDLTGTEQFRWSAPLGNVQGMEIVDGELAIYQDGAPEIKFYDPTNGDLTRVIPSAIPSDGGGLAYDGTDLWIAHDATAITAVDPTDGLFLRQIIWSGDGLTETTGVAPGGPGVLVTASIHGGWAKVDDATGQRIQSGRNFLDWWGLTARYSSGFNHATTLSNGQTVSGQDFGNRMLPSPMVIDVDPAPNSETVPTTTDITIRYDQDIDPNSATADAFAVHSAQRVVPSSTMSVIQDTIQLALNHAFRPGELVRATATSRVIGTNGVNAERYAWQFRIEVSGGYGWFLESGQSFGATDSLTVALGDLDGDGDLDAMIGNIGANRVWLNDGSGTFTDTGQALGNALTHSIALGDVDGDGDLDAFVANGNFEADQVWLNDGQAGFSNSGQSLGSVSSRSVELADLDRDGDLDAITATFGGGNRVWLNDGLGHYIDTGQRLGNATSDAVAVGDVDGDGDFDALFGNFEPSTVWLNDGNGIFTDSGQAIGTTDAADVELGDIDGDGDLDAVVASRSGDANLVWLNDGTGLFTDSGQRFGSNDTVSVALGDVDADGDLDAVFANDFGGGAPQPDEVWINDGNGTFTDSRQSLGNAQSREVQLADLDNDGDLDAFVAGVFSTSTSWMNSNTCRGDFDGSGLVEQGDLDLVLLHWGDAYDTLPATWVRDRPTTGIVDQQELDCVLLNWGSAPSRARSAAMLYLPTTLATASTNEVPEIVSIFSTNRRDLSPNSAFFGAENERVGRNQASLHKSRDAALATWSASKSLRLHSVGVHGRASALTSGFDDHLDSRIHDTLRSGHSLS